MSLKNDLDNSISDPLQQNRLLAGKIDSGENTSGAKNGSTVTAVESGNGAMHKTVLTLTNTPISVVSVTTGAGVGGTKVYDWPLGYLHMHGCFANLSLSIASGSQADFTDGTPEGDIGVGSLAPANADALGTDATDDDYATAVAFVGVAFADADIICAPEASLNQDGTSTAKNMFVNVLVDAADIDDSTTSEVLISGTITFHWSNLGIA